MVLEVKVEVQLTVTSWRLRNLFDEFHLSQRKLWASTVLRLVIALWSFLPSPTQNTQCQARRQWDPFISIRNWNVEHLEFGMVSFWSSSKSKPNNTECQAGKHWVTFYFFIYFTVSSTTQKRIQSFPSRQFWLSNLKRHLWQLRCWTGPSRWRKNWDTRPFSKPLWQDEKHWCLKGARNWLFLAAKKEPTTNAIFTSTITNCKTSIVTRAQK